jgi:hypothetical protein
MAASAHIGKVRAFPELGSSSRSGRRWAARCSCGWAATASKWAQVLEAPARHQAKPAA